MPTTNSETQTQTEVDNDSLGWNEGRRIVELGFLAEQLKLCQECKKNPLHLSDCVSEIRCGFGSLLKIQCSTCNRINNIYTGKQHRTEDKNDKGLKIWDVNSKAALGKNIFLLSFLKICICFHI